MRRRSLICRVGFTLLELLIVIAVIAILASLLLPSLSKAKHVAKRSVCMSNLKQCFFAMASYSSDNNSNIAVATTGGGFAWDRWLGVLYKNSYDEPQGYLTNPDVAVCPSYIPNKFTASGMAHGGVYMTYGILWSLTYKLFDGASTRIEPSSGKYIYTLKINKIGKPSECPILMDSINIDWATQYCTSDTDGNYVHQRHLNSTNVVMIDGHIEPAKRTRLKELYIKGVRVLDGTYVTF